MYSLEENSYLSDLFYYDLSLKKHADLRKGIIEYQFLLLTSLSAIQYLQKKDLEKFDSLVGENACQIRAIRTALIASKDLDDFEDLRARMNIALDKIDQLLLPNSLNRLMREGCSLKELLATHNLNVELTAEQSFIIQSYLLTEMKETLSDSEFSSSLLRIEKSNPRKLQHLFPHISYSFVSQLASKLRRLLSNSSVQFVREAAFCLQDKDLLRMVSPELAIEHNSWLCLPMFWTYKILLSLIHIKQIPLILHVKFLNKLRDGYQTIDEEFLFFKPCYKTNSYQKTSPHEQDLSKAACVIQGVACLEKSQQGHFKEKWKELIIEQSVIDIVLAGAADHRQYPTSNFKGFVQEFEYENYKKIAQTKGFSLDNPSTFFIQHVYASQVSQKIEAWAAPNTLFSEALSLRPALAF